MNCSSIFGADVEFSVSTMTVDIIVELFILKSVYNWNHEFISKIEKFTSEWNLEDEKVDIDKHITQ